MRKMTRFLVIFLCHNFQSVEISRECVFVSRTLNNISTFFDAKITS